MTTALLSRTETAPRHEWVAAPPFRALLRQLVSDSGLGWRVLARVAGVPAPTVYGLLRGLNGQPVRQLRQGDAAKLLRLDLRLLRELDSEPGDSGVLRTLAWRLGLQGCSIAEIATHTDLAETTARELMSGGAPWCSRLQVLRAEAACEALGLDPEAVKVTTAMGRVG